MRSSIACLGCRKSKIKCDNDGGISPCDPCIKTGKDCHYPETSGNSSKRPDLATIKPDRDSSGPGVGWNQPGHDRKRFKRVDDMAKIENDRAPLYAEDALSHHFLTEDLWDSLFSIYKLHFATELPFLHIATLRERISEKTKPQNVNESYTAANNLVLLGVLTLTARFHPDLVRYIGNQVNPGTGSARSRPVHTKFEPSQASEYYAEVLTKALGPLRTCMTELCIERVQAFLILGLYEWTQSTPETGGAGAWMYVGVAIRMAQALGLGVGDKLDDSSGHSRRSASTGMLLSADLVFEKEIRRRTMFSCLLLDRMMSCGKDRVPMIQSKDLQIQLPCSEDAFDLSRDVYTGFLGDLAAPDLEGRARDDSVLGRFIQLVDLWGDISKFSFSGGRLNEIYPPWDKETAFYKLSAKLDRFYEELPETFCLSKQNYYRHDNHQASSVYVSLHMLGAVCKIMLHREYIPYIPIRCKKPSGPLDSPRFPADEYDIPAGFWSNSADQVFQGARDIVDLINICQKRERDNLPQSILVVYSVWSASFVGIYAYMFPHMDCQMRMLEGVDEPDSVDITTVGPAGAAFQALKKLSQFNKVAATYCKHFYTCERFYRVAKHDYEWSTSQQGAENETQKPLSIRHGGPGGGLAEWKRDGAAITNYGTILASTVSVDVESITEPSKYQTNAYHPHSSEIEPEYGVSTNRDSPRVSGLSSFRAINTRQPPLHGSDSSQELLKTLAREAGTLHEANQGDGRRATEVAGVVPVRLRPSPPNVYVDQYASYMKIEGKRFGEAGSNLSNTTCIGGDFFPHWPVGHPDQMADGRWEGNAPYLLRSPKQQYHQQEEGDDIKMGSDGLRRGI